MPSYNLCILGFGNVGQALVRHLQLKTAELREQYDITWRLTGVATRHMGWIADFGRPGHNILYWRDSFRQFHLLAM